MKRLIKYLPAGILLFWLAACQSGSKVKTFEGDLTFKLVEFGSFYALQDGLEKEFTDYKDSLKTLPAETLAPYEQEFLQFTQLLEENGLLQLPYFKLKSGDEIYTVYCDSVDYANVSHFKRSTLLQEGKKVKIQLAGTLVAPDGPESPPIIRCQQMLTVEKVNGTTEWRK